LGGATTGAGTDSGMGFGAGAGASLLQSPSGCR